jgi:hypothetical protein
MLAVPYLSLAVVGFFIYRGCKKNMAYREALARAAMQPPSDVVQSGQGAT